MKRGNINLEEPELSVQFSTALRRLGTAVVAPSMSVLRNTDDRHEMRIAAYTLISGNPDPEHQKTRSHAMGIIDVYLERETDDVARNRLLAAREFVSTAFKDR